MNSNTKNEEEERTVNIDEILEAKTATTAVQAAIAMLGQGNAPELLENPTFVRATRQAIYNTDQRRGKWARAVIEATPENLRPLAKRELIPATCQI